jgi:DNA repair protein RecN (Recombination protein N)
VLHELHIAGLGVIDDLDLELHPGLNVLTGETGTGKTMVTIGLALALGARGSSTLVRTGAPAVRVQARFDAPADDAAAADWVEEGELLLARTVSAEGKSSARAGGQLVTASALATLGEQLVEVHGQHQTQRLLAPAAQTAFLDRFAGDRHLGAVASYREAFGRLRDVRAALERLREGARDRDRELDLMTYQVREIEGAAPQPGESQELAMEEGRLAHVERLVDRAVVAESALAGNDADGGTGAAELLSAAARSLDEAAGLDVRAQDLMRRAEGLTAEATELGRDLRDYREGLVADPERLHLVRERLAALKGLQRKYGETDADVRSYLERAVAAVTELSGADDRLVELDAEVTAISGTVGERGAAVTSGRHRAAGALGDALTAELRELGMPGARVDVRLEPVAEPGPDGLERVGMLLAPGPSQRASPLATTASGGELSRTMLACRSVLADLDDVPTLVFDEVDAGIGGQAGLAVGRRLAGLAADRQVLVVTHLPQIACFADQHVRITKRGGSAAVRVLDGDGRVSELSRMLAGMADSAAAISHARELLVEGRRERVDAGS